MSQNQFVKDELYQQLLKLGKDSATAVYLLHDIERLGHISFLVCSSKQATKLQNVFHSHHPLYSFNNAREFGNDWLTVEIVYKCAQPQAPWTRCVECNAWVKTCERKMSSNESYACPGHDGTQLSNGKWVCSEKCWEVITNHLETSAK